MYGWLGLSGETDVGGMARATFDALGCEMLCVTRGGDGAALITKSEGFAEHPGFVVDAVDTVGGGLVPRHAPRQIARRRVRERRAGTRVSRRGVRRDATGRHPEARSGGHRRPRREKVEKKDAKYRGRERDARAYPSTTRLPMQDRPAR